MTGHPVRLGTGARVVFDGDVVEIVELDGSRVTVRNDRTKQFTVLGLTRLVGDCHAVATGAHTDEALASAGVVFAGLTPEQQREASERAGHVREVLTGYRAGYAEAAAPDERGARVDTRWTTRCARWWPTASKPRPRHAARLRKVTSRLDELHGAGVVARPSPATAYRRLQALSKGSNAVSGSAKGRRSIADRSQGTHGRLRATRPGEYVVLDTQDLDLFAMEEVSCRWVPVQLTLAQDPFTRCAVGLRVTPVSTKAIDVAGVLYQAVVPQPAPANWPAEACWPYHGVPHQVLFGEEQPARAPVCAPETLVVDHGKMLLSAHVLSVCTRSGSPSNLPSRTSRPTSPPANGSSRRCARG